MYIGAHVSIAGGVFEAPGRASELKANAMGLFTKNQRQWSAEPLTDEAVALFKSRFKEANMLPEHAVVHASYLINPANPDPEKRARSVAALLDECRRAETLGLQLVNFHPGSGLTELTEDETIAAIAEGLHAVLDQTQSARPVLEGTAGQGAHVGYRFSHLADIIDQAGGDPRIGICLDTCHAYAAGYDLATSEGYAAMIDEIAATAGLDRLVAVHLNDSKVELGSRKDRHECIGDGLIGTDGLRHIVTDPRLEKVPFVLETPRPERWKAEIELVRTINSGR